MEYPGGVSDNEYKILKFIADREMVADPKTVAANIDVDRDEVKNAMPRLLKKGFLKRPSRVPNGLSERGLYEATELGMAYADGDKTIADLRELLEDSNRDNN